MRVLIDTSYAERGPSGTGVYIEQLVRALREGGRVEVHTAAQPRRGAPGGSPARSAVNAVLDADWLHRGLPATAARVGADVVHHPLPAHSTRIAAAQVTTVHDVAFMRMPDAYPRAWRRYALWRYRRAARRCGALLCPSRATAADARDLLGAGEDRLFDASYGPGQVTPSREARADAPEGPLVFVGDREPRKNLPSLLAAYARYRAREERPARLVLAGAAADAAGAEGVEGFRPRDAGELAGLLRSARALVHPSSHEGFGFTLVEAMAAGVPVVAVDSDGARELCGDAALFTDLESLDRSLGRIAQDAALRSRLAAAGHQRAARRSWADSARAHERAYTLALRGAVTAHLAP